MFRLIVLLRKERFDTVFVLHWAWQFNVLVFLCGIPVRVGFKRNLGRLFLTHPVRADENQNNREAYLRLLKIFGVSARYQKSHYYLSEQENRFLETFVAEHRMDAEEQLIALAPGGGRNIKQTMLTRLWPVDRYIELIGNFLQAGPYRIVLIAGPDDGPVIQPILDRYPQCIDTSALSFGEKASLLRRCRLLVGNDSAPIHMASALSVPTYSLWGPTNPKRYGDPAQHHTTFFKKVECSPCYSYGEFPACNDNQPVHASHFRRRGLGNTPGRIKPENSDACYYWKVCTRERVSWRNCFCSASGPGAPQPTHCLKFTDRICILILKSR